MVQPLGTQRGAPSFGGNFSVTRTELWPIGSAPPPQTPVTASCHRTLCPSPCLGDSTLRRPSTRTPSLRGNVGVTGHNESMNHSSLSIGRRMTMLPNCSQHVPYHNPYEVRGVDPHSLNPPQPFKCQCSRRLRGVVPLSIPPRRLPRFNFFSAIRLENEINNSLI